MKLCSRDVILQKTCLSIKHVPTASKNIILRKLTIKGRVRKHGVRKNRNDGLALASELTCMFSGHTTETCLTLGR